MNKTNIILIGMMGTFKSSAGKIVAKITDKNFIDTDELVKALSGKSIPELFSKGEECFREFERQAIKIACEGDNTVIACGGGAATFDYNIEVLKNSGYVVLLTATPQAIFKRVKSDKSRPLLMGGNLKEKINDLICKRMPIYNEVANCVVDNTGLSSTETAKEIIKKTIDI